MFRLVTGIPGPSGFGSASTAEQVTQGIDASNLTLVITARNMEAANDAKQKILKQNDRARVDAMMLDLCSIRSIKEFAERFYALNVPLNILINNAGIMFCPFQLSEDGVEVQFATNHLGHFYLTNLLLHKMKETAKLTGIQGRIVNLSSVAHNYTYKKGINFDKINDKRRYSDKKAYGQSKLANILHANELSRRLQAEKANITVNSVHPGLIMTNLFKHSATLMGFLKLFSFFMWKNVPQGAATTCYVALHHQLKDSTGKYFNDCNEYKPSKLAKNEDLAKKLWDFSNKLIDSALAKNAETSL
ncbi:hypothetical protein Leryth_011687 [Lithospermum erythrorhizon]|nr:hypothetical protein Leryth_011687 [Lithospermum erythrorhizon]